MSKRHHVTDLAVHLSTELTEAVTVTGLPDAATGAGAWSLVQLAPAAKWAGATAALGQTLLVLEGAATVQVDDWRYTGASGHLISLAPGASLGIHNDGSTAFAALLREDLAGSAPDSKLAEPVFDAKLD